jgi:hypothetical protein
MPVKKSVRSKTPAASKTPVASEAPVASETPSPVKKSPRFSATFGAVTFFLAVIGVVAAAMLIAAREPSPAEIVRVDAVPGKATAEAAKKASASKTPSATIDPAAGLVVNVTPATARPESAPAAVTMTGCLERHDETFRLKDPTGADVPKSRSWKSGFLKKGSASIDVVDASHKLKLTDHVGQRVRLKGVLGDREMQVRSLQRVAASCNEPPH